MFVLIYLMREGVPAIVDVPQPIFIPESPHSVGKDKPVVAEPPATLHELILRK